MSERITAQAARMVSRAASAAPNRGFLLRQCACGQHAGGGECESCKAKKERMQRATVSASPSNEIPPAVGEALDSAGRPLDKATRAFMGSRFGYDFSGVSVHTDSKAAESARAVDALAYTVGQHVVFGAGQYNPRTDAGSKLLAHELAHVVQNGRGTKTGPGISDPSDAREGAADAAAEKVMSGATIRPSELAGPGQALALRLMRRVAARLAHCTANTDGAPADPIAELTDDDTKARDFATQLSTALADDAREARTGLPATPSDTFQSYQDHFGLPVAARGGFLNRLTGVVRASQGVAMSEELNILARRFALVARTYSQFVNYLCVNREGVGFGGCESGPCDQGDAWSCRGVDAIFLCPSFWSAYDSDGRAGILMHEAFHMVLGPTSPRQVGQIGDETQRGPGRNFNIAGCYEAISNDVLGINSAFSCPNPP